MGARSLSIKWFLVSHLEEERREQSDIRGCILRLRDGTESLSCLK